jgi:hypothetical protein
MRLRRRKTKQEAMAQRSRLQRRLAEMRNRISPGLAYPDGGVTKTDIEVITSARRFLASRLGTD